MAYPTVDEVCSHIGVDDTSENGRVAVALNSAIRDCEAYTGYRFVPDSVVSTRTFRPVYGQVILDSGSSIATTTGLIVKTDDSLVGTYGTTWTVDTDYVLEPFDGVGPDGSTGWPYTRVVGVGARYFPQSYTRRSVQITATWGWAETPAQVKTAVLLRAAALWKRKDAPYGVAGFADLGAFRVREDPDVESLLELYVHPMRNAMVA